MHALGRAVTATAAFIAAATLSLSLLPPAAAQDDSRFASVNRSTGTKGDLQGRTLTTRVETRQVNGPRVTVDGSEAGSLTPDNSNWTPPPCWYEPWVTPEQARDLVGGMGSLPLVGGILSKYFEVLLKERPGEWENYNLDKQGRGMFWIGVVNPNRKDEPGANDCAKPPFWVEKNRTPDVPLAVDAQILAEFAYDEIRIPDTDVGMKPAGEQKVNLPTWIWLDKGTFRPVSVTAELPDAGLSATTTAEPVALRIEPGTQDAELHPASGECRIGDEGGIGAPYRGDTDALPPCGLTYRRSTERGGPYKLSATVLWEVSWKGSDGEGGDLPDGAFGSSRKITVEEVQTVVR